MRRDAKQKGEEGGRHERRRTSRDVGRPPKDGALWNVALNCENGSAGNWDTWERLGSVS